MENDLLTLIKTPVMTPRINKPNILSSTFANTTVKTAIIKKG